MAKSPPPPSSSARTHKGSRPFDRIVLALGLLAALALCVIVTLFVARRLGPDSPLVWSAGFVGFYTMAWIAGESSLGRLAHFFEGPDEIDDCRPPN